MRKTDKKDSFPGIKHGKKELEKIKNSYNDLLRIYNKDEIKKYLMLGKEKYNGDKSIAISLFALTFSVVSFVLSNFDIFNGQERLICVGIATLIIAIIAFILALINYLIVKFITSKRSSIEKMLIYIDLEEKDIDVNPQKSNIEEQRSIKNKKKKR